MMGKFGQETDRNKGPCAPTTARTVKGCLFAALAAWTFSGDLRAGELVPPAGLEGYFADEVNSAEFENRTLDYLNELSARRRLTTVFPNEQSPFYGVQLNYVNVGEGNLTFLMRDLVRGARLPIVVGRVHDSRIRDGSDFGPGWKLSVAESLRRVGNEMVYTDASNSTHALRIDGSRLLSGHPHLTGIAGGSLAPNWAVIRTGGLAKTFRRYRDSLRLIEVRDGSDNWLRFNYSGAAVSRVVSSSGRYVQLRRDRSGKIVAAVDDAGRSVSYRYDPAGALIESVGVSGGATRFRYDGRGYLSAVIDPRGFESIAAQFRADGRAAVVDSQHERTVYEFGANSTTVRNARQLAGILGFHESGLVESATDFAGGVSNIEFDPDLRVVRLMFNGVTVASAEYADGRIVALSRLDWHDKSAGGQSFGYGPDGRLAGVSLDGQAVASYSYDAAGRVIRAVDSIFRDAGTDGARGPDEVGNAGRDRPGVERRYRYDAAGDLSAVSIGDAHMGFRTNRLGMVERVTWAANNAIGIAYDETDRVETLRFDLGADSVAAGYRYDDAGFRVAGRYDVLEPLGRTEVALEYDSAGNIVRIELPGPGGETRVTEHTIGSENELLGVTPLRAPAFGQAFEYDGSGRAVKSAQGNGREATFSYDGLGRLTDVHLDREHVLTSDHGPMDLDPVHAADARTAFTATGDPVAPAVFGSLDEIVYTRPRGTPYGLVRFVPEMARFVIADRAAVPPDALILASLRRRNLAAEETLDASPLQGFDKLSSSLFLPPEFFSSNCGYCVGGVTAFEIGRVGAGPVTAGETVTFVADGRSEFCNYYFYEDLDSGGILTFPYTFTHDVDFVGGSGDATYTTTSAYKRFSGSFSSPGVKTVRDTLSCGCGGIFLGLDEESVCVEPPYLAPIQSVPPTPTEVSAARISGAWGQASIGFNDTLHCSALCDNSYRLDGTISVTPSSYVRVSNQVPAVGTCSVSKRTAGNIAHTTTHELIHANAFVGAINSFKAPIGTRFGSLSACTLAVDSLQAGLNAAFAAEVNRQSNHLDHAGERRHFAYCPSPNGSAREGVCGLVSGYSCPNPPGDFYPGP